MYILNVEDDPAIREAISDVLRYAGYQVKTAENGQEALDLLRTGEKPALILLDLMMPVLDGWQFIETVLNENDLKEIPIVVVSAVAAVTQMADRPNIKKIIKKPVSIEQLLDVVKEFNTGKAVKKVLVVDDDEAISSALKAVLESEGHEVLVASDGEKALDILLVEKVQVDLILLDLYMPKVNGWEFAKRLKESQIDQKKHVPIVISSASNKKEEIESTQQFDSFLLKPFNLEKLIETCNRFL